MFTFFGLMIGALLFKGGLQASSEYHESIKRGLEGKRIARTAKRLGIKPAKLVEQYIHVVHGRDLDPIVAMAARVEKKLERGIPLTKTDRAVLDFFQCAAPCAAPPDSTSKKGKRKAGK
jgi:hypothetical protein